MATNLNIQSVYSRLQERGLKNVTAKCVDAKKFGVNLAKVIVETNTEHATKEAYFAAICASFDNQARPIDGTFRWVRSTRSPLPTMVGFVKANVGIRSIQEKEAPHMRVFASNILMDSRDESLWKVESTKEGPILVRNDKENLSALLECASANRSTLSAKLKSDMILHSTKSEHRIFASFVMPETAKLSAGYILEAEGETAEIVPFNNELSSVTVPVDCIVEMANLNGDDVFEELAAPKTSDKAKMIAYYKQIYGQMDKDYFKKLVDIINSHSAI